MSNLLSRLAARAVGERRAATPRPPGPVEGPGAGDAVDALEPFDEQSAPVTSAPAMPPGPPLAAGSAPVPADGETVRSESRAQAEPPAAELLATVDRILSPVPAAAPSAWEPAGALTDAAPDAEGQAAPALPPAAAPVAVAMPASVPEPVVHTAAVAPAARAEPDTVRVHIGRLEVRANLSPPSPPQRPRADAPGRRDELTLTDYLRGRR